MQLKDARRRAIALAKTMEEGVITVYRLRPRQFAFQKGHGPEGNDTVMIVHVKWAKGGYYDKCHPGWVEEGSEDYRCPYCHQPLTDADATGDNDALWCADCAQRVEYFDALAACEEWVSCFAFPPTESSSSVTAVEKRLVYIEEAS